MIFFLCSVFERSQKFMINSRRALRPRGIDGAWVFLSPLRTIAMRKKVKVKKR